MARLAKFQISLCSHAATLELAIRQTDLAMFEVRARGRWQRKMIVRARGFA